MKYLLNQLPADKLTPSWEFTGMITGGWRGPSISMEARDNITQLAHSHITLEGDWSFCPISKSDRPSEFDCYYDPFGDNFLNHHSPAKARKKINHFFKKQSKGRLEHTMLTKPNAFKFEPPASHSSSIAL